MTNKTTIVDAVSTPVTAAPSLSAADSSVKINTTQMEKALQEMAMKAIASAQQQQGATQETVERVNPSVFLKDMTTEIERLYQRFDTLKVLAAEINGMSTNEQFPPQVIFKGLTLDFAISKNGEVKDHSVKMQAISGIGDVANLMSNEFGFIIASLRELSKQVADLAQKTNDRCNEAFKEWEASNKNKQIIPADDSTVALNSSAEEIPSHVG